MRITNNYMSSNLLRNLNYALERMSRIENQLASEKKISRPSDDPVGLDSSLRLRNTLSNIEQWQANASDGLSYMETADSVLADMTKMIQRASELTIRAANETLTEENRKNVAKEIAQIREQIVQLCNTKVGDRYIFGGTKNREPLPENIANDQGITGDDKWQGSPDEVNYPLGNGVELAITVNGLDFFSYESNGNKKGILDTLDTLYDALTKDDGNRIQECITELENHSDNIVSSRATLGARVNRLESIQGQLEATHFHLTKNYSDIMDVDIARTMIDFNTTRNAYTAALSVGAQIIKPSLVDFMR